MLVVDEYSPKGRKHVPVKVLRGTDSDDGVGIGQAGEDADSAER